MNIPEEGPVARARYHRARGMIHSLIRSRSILASLGFAFAGAAFTFGNLLLAGALPPAAFGQLSLSIAVYNVFIWLAPLGLDQVLLRRRLDPGARLLLRAFLSCSGIAAIAAIGTVQFYELPALSGLLLGAAIVGGGMAMAASMGLRRHDWTALPLVATNVASWALLFAGGLGLVLTLGSDLPVLLILAAGCALAAALSWYAFIRYCGLGDERPDKVPRGEAFSLMVTAGAGSVLVQIERFVIPQVLDFRALALFAVIASVAIFPFRLLRSGSSFALTPRLRAASQRAERHALLAQETRSLGLTMVFATLVVVALAPIVATIFTGGRYELDRLLVLAACFNGAAKLIEGLPRAAVVACGTAEEIRKLSWMNWLTIAACLLGAWIGARWGLVGLISGSAVGCLASTIAPASLARHALSRGFVE
ncbi:lipopolysaccharide biosynthesis protein [Novosphingobium pentaromativorans]|uniref:Polysaccharide biosynthesis protein n=2 Tax=Novosphingobium pentaromativorans TaxID=205844 RepID=G6E9S2_9SPHN|nr:hypothetical protein [Novosphingobium pentaromativorans]AIT80927.1 hypothetical protein JI59_14630 [Novosphingobium pentaromativorans US6-1]EHJ61927.1 hypothetical protein NSU_1093 [Novosphingobium pentaromativorans US6-1]